MQEIIDNWDKFLNTLEKDLPAASFDLWFKPLAPVALDNDYIVIKAPSTAAKNFIAKNHLSLFIEALKNSFSNYQNYKILDPAETEDYLKNKQNNKSSANSQQQEEKENQPVATPSSQNRFIKKYSFANFVVGKSNQFVYASATAVAENPGTKFNPLFIYGGPGLGKTHLLHSIGSSILTNKPDLKVVYCTCENFINDYVESLTSKSVNKFRSQYRNVDVLMIDDIQFLINKTSTQEEFFHTFNDLYQHGKQIILTSDRNPKELTTLEDRLKSRFQSGLIQDIQSPEYETRLAILEKKVEIEGLRISKEALIYIAEKIETNVRELEGFLQKVCFHSALLGKGEANITDARNAFDDKVLEEKKDLTEDKIIACVCEYTGVSEENLKGKKRSKEYVEARQYAIYLICEMMPDLPLVSIGLLFGQRDHTTVIHSRDKIEREIRINSQTKQKIADIKANIIN